jgi:hypothetical protein
VAAFSVLRHEERVRLDPTCLVELYARLGEERAERLVGTAMEELAARITDVHLFALDGNEPALIRCAERLSLIARDIGMTTLARVARDVVDTALGGDHTAQAATVARLCRTGDRSLAAIWGIRDVSV